MGDESFGIGECYHLGAAENSDLEIGFFLACMMDPSGESFQLWGSDSTGCFGIVDGLVEQLACLSWSRGSILCHVVNVDAEMIRSLAAKVVDPSLVTISHDFQSFDSAVVRDGGSVGAGCDGEPLILEVLQLSPALVELRSAGSQ